MKAQFVFDLPQEQEEWAIFNNAHKLHSVLWDHLEQLRKTIKYSENEIEVIYAEKIRQDLINLLAEKEVSIF